MDALSAMRRYAFGFVNGHDFDVCRQLMTEDYALHYGPDLVQGRDQNYIPAVQHQIAQFPNLGYAIHDLISDGEWTAVYFSEHGASAKSPGRSASWLGVGLYRFDGKRLSEAWVVQDHYSRRQQLDSDCPVHVLQIATDPWANAVQPSEEGVAELVASWWKARSSWPTDDAAFEVDPGKYEQDQPRLDELDVVVDQMVTSGARAAFHVTVSGRYRGGLPGYAASGRRVTHYAAGFATIADGAIDSIQVISHRLGVQRQLRTGARV